MPISRTRPAVRPAPLPKVASTLVVCLGIVCASDQARTAQQPTLPEVVVSGTGFDGLTLDDTSTTGSRLGFRLRDIPASVDVVYQRNLQDRGARTVVDALQGVTGLTGAVRAGAPGVYSSRGFVENGISLLYDGIRVGASTVYTRPYDAFNFDRIEVMRGPASALHGDSAVGGVINYVRRAPSAGPVRIEALASMGSHSNLRLGAAASGSLTPSTSFVLSAVGRSGDSFVDQNSTAEGHLVGGLAFDLGGGRRLLLETDYWRSSTDNAYWGTPLVNGRIDPALRRANYNISPDNQYLDSVWWTRAALDYGLGGWQARTQVYLYRADRNWKNFAAPRYNTATGPGAPFAPSVTVREVEDLVYDNDQLGLRHEMRTEGSVRAMRYRFVAGLDLSRSSFESPRFQAGPTNAIAVDPLNPGSRSFAAFAGPRDRLRAADIDTTALYTEASLDLTQRLRAFGGYRFDSLEVRTRFQNPGGAVQQGARDYSLNNYRLGLSFAATPGTTVYGAASTGNEPVDNSGFAFIAPADLQQTSPTSATQFELGTKHQFAGGRAEVTTAVYQVTRKNALSADPQNPGGPRLLVGEQSAQGVEVAGAWRISRAIAVFGNLASVDAQYDRFVSGGVNVGGNRPRMVPKLVATAGLSVRPMPSLELSGIVRRVGDNPLNDTNTVFLPAYTVGDLFARYRVSRDLDVTAAVRNVADRVYADWGIQFLGAQVANLAPPRTFELSLRARF
ncbi:MAG: TonB-dependent receptor [Burkholderiales bacterium]|nr:TonB-dependent receptor [Burkholderiales bacterium]